MPAVRDKKTRGGSSSYLTFEDKQFLHSMKQRNISSQLPMLTEQVIIMSNRLQKNGSKNERTAKHALLVSLVAFAAVLYQFLFNLVNEAIPRWLYVILGFVVITALLVILDWSFNLVDRKKK